MIARQAGAHHQVGATALLGIRHLAGDYGFDVGLAHAPAHPDAVDLDGARGRNDDDGVDAAVALDLEQQRDVQDHRTAPGAAGAATKARSSASTIGWRMCSSRVSASRLPSTAWRARRGRRRRRRGAGEGSLDRLDRPAAVACS